MKFAPLKRFIKIRPFQGPLFFLLIMPGLILAQEPAVKENPTLDFTYLKKSDGSKLLTATLSIFRDRVTYPIIEAPVAFYVGTDTITTTIMTNDDGRAFLLLQPGVTIPCDKEGLSLCTAKFGGNDSLEMAETSLSVMDAILKMSLDYIDSIKTVTVWAFKTIKGEDSIPLSGETVKVYVTRMFSLLNIGEGSLDENGRMTIEFPSDLPGEHDGTVQVIAKIEENEQYANVETVKSYTWGVPSMHGTTGSHRALWTQIAPMWMIVTLTILLLGVWGHYIYVIIQLIFINRESKNNLKL